MADIVAVLVVADADSPLLAPGPCGGAPPRVACSAHGSWYVAAWDVGGVALPLRWDGHLVPEGWDRARRVLWTSPQGIVRGWRGETVRWAELASLPTLRTVQRCAELLVHADLASRVVLLTRDAEGRLVEVPDAG